ncbi:hypothetical protein [Campylobacter pinnipediorum]|nr:hypothetical protein [Campylobacter pinnipediorum]
MKDKERTANNVRALANIDLLKLFKDMRQRFKQVKENIKKAGY